MSLSIIPPNQIVQASHTISLLRQNPIVALALGILVGLSAIFLRQINKLKADLNEKNTQVNNLTSELNAKAAEKSSLENRCNAANDEIKALQAEKVDLEAAKVGLEAVLAEAQKANELIQQKLDSLNQENNDLKAKNEVLEKQVAPIEMRELTEIPDYLPMDESLPIEEKENMEQSIPLQIGQGKVKQVWIKKNKDTAIVYYTTLGSSAEKELKEEVKTTQKILDRLKKECPEGLEFYLAIDLKESERPIRDAHGAALFTVQCAKADKDLEKHLRAPISFNTRLKMCLQVLKGLSYLQQAGYVQGDLKPENILVYHANDEKRTTLRIADFGKACEVASEQSLTVRGNPRFCSPELETSRKAEVYSAALVMLRILEEALLNKTTSLIHIEKPKEQAGPQRRGVEKYLVEHPDTWQVDQWKSAGGIKLACACYAPASFSIHIASQNALYAYIDRLAEQLECNRLMQNPSELQNLLKQMTCNDKTKRLSMQEACDRLKVLVTA